MHLFICSPCLHAKNSRPCNAGKIRFYRNPFLKQYWTNASRSAQIDEGIGVSAKLLAGTIALTGVGGDVGAGAFVGGGGVGAVGNGVGSTTYGLEVTDAPIVPSLTSSIPDTTFTSSATLVATCAGSSM